MVLKENRKEAFHCWSPHSRETHLIQLLEGMLRLVGVRKMVLLCDCLQDMLVVHGRVENEWRSLQFECAGVGKPLCASRTISPNWRFQSKDRLSDRGNVS